MKQKFTMLLTAIAILAFFASGIRAQEVSTPRTPSPAASVSQTIGISKITVNYSRPAVKGREVWGKLVPYGWNVQGFGAGKEAPWRAGANENTIIEFSSEVKIDGKIVPSGQYGLFFVINKDDSGEVILSKDYRSWGSFFYDPAQDQLRAKIQLRNIPNTELLSYDFINLTKNSGELVLNWEKKQFPVLIEIDVDKIVMANAVEELKGPVGFTWQGAASAAKYAADNKINQEQALKWASIAVKQHNSFATLNTKADLLRQTGKTEEAEKTTAEALKVATEAELNQYGYQLLNDKKYDEAIKVMTLNTEQHPESANAWDSLGEVYATKGDKPNAIKYFKKSLSMNPEPNVKANSEKYLKELEGKQP